MEQSERDRFVEELRVCKPTHYGDDEELQGLLDSFINVDYEAFSSLVFPEKLVIDLAIAYSTKYSGYTPGSVIDEGKPFNAKHPLIIFSTAPEAEDRCLIWANGVIHYSASGIITLFVDKDLMRILQG